MLINFLITILVKKAQENTYKYVKVYEWMQKS